MDERVDRMRRQGRFGEARQDQFELAGIKGDVADRENAGARGGATRGIDANAVVVDVQPPGAERAEIGRETEKRQQAVGVEAARFAGEVGNDDGRELPAIAFERVQLIRHDQIDPPFVGELLQLGGRLRRGAKLAAAMHHGDALGDVRK